MTLPLCVVRCSVAGQRPLPPTVIDLSLSRRRRLDVLVTATQLCLSLPVCQQWAPLQLLPPSQSTLRSPTPNHLHHPQNTCLCTNRDVEEDIVPVCRELGIGIVAYSPLGRGILTGAYSKPEGLPEGEAGVSISEVCGLSVSQLTGHSE